VDRIRLGRLGEKKAAAYLKQLGFEILAIDYRLPFAQIDIIAREGQTIVFVEVKTRRDERFGLPGESVTWLKQQKLIKAGLWYLASKNLSHRAFRFDVITVMRGEGGQWILKRIKNAFP